MKGIVVLKFATGIAISSGVGTIVRNVVKNNVVPRNKLDEVAIFAAKYGIAAVISSAAIDHAEKNIDAAVKWYTNTFGS